MSRDLGSPLAPTFGGGKEKRQKAKAARKDKRAVRKAAVKEKNKLSGDKLTKGQKRFSGIAGSAVGLASIGLFIASQIKKK